jgi:hypothetical protein
MRDFLMSLRSAQVCSGGYATCCIFVILTIRLVDDQQLTDTCSILLILLAFVNKYSQITHVHGITWGYYLLTSPKQNALLVGGGKQMS